MAYFYSSSLLLKSSNSSTTKILSGSCSLLLLSLSAIFWEKSFGLSLVSSTVSAVIISTIPLFSPIAAYFILKETVSKDVILGIVVSFIGILIMLINPDFSISASPKGILLLFFAVLAAVAYSVVIKKLAFNYRPATIILLQNSLGVSTFSAIVSHLRLKSLFINPATKRSFSTYSN